MGGAAAPDSTPARSKDCNTSYSCRLYSQCAPARRARPPRPHCSAAGFPHPALSCTPSAASSSAIRSAVSAADLYRCCGAAHGAAPDEGAVREEETRAAPPRPAPRPAPADKQAAPTTPSRRKQGAVRMKRKLEVDQEFINRKGEKRKKEDIS